MLITGRDPDAFWGMTAKEVEIVQGAHAERRRLDHNDRAWAVWHGAVLPKLKKMPPLDKLQASGLGRSVPRQDWKTQEAILSEW